MNKINCLSAKYSVTLFSREEEEELLQKNKYFFGFNSDNYLITILLSDGFICQL